MQMTKAEIIRKYREADNKNAMIKILAQLNGVSVLKIKSILYEAGEIDQLAFEGRNKSATEYTFWTPEECEQIVSLRHEGLKFKEIANYFPKHREQSVGAKYRSIMKEEAARV